jgi:hypothetical protein
MIIISTLTRQSISITNWCMTKEDNPANMDRMITPIPKALLAKVDEIRFSGRFLSRAHTVRTLLEEAIEARERIEIIPGGATLKGNGK